MCACICSCAYIHVCILVMSHIDTYSMCHTRIDVCPETHTQLSLNVNAYMHVHPHMSTRASITHTHISPNTCLRVGALTLMSPFGPCVVHAYSQICTMTHTCMHTYTQRHVNAHTCIITALHVQQFHIYVLASMYMHAYVAHTFTSAYANARERVNTKTHVYTPTTHSDMHTNTCRYIHTYTSEHTHKHPCIQVRLYASRAHQHTCSCTLTWTLIHTNIHMRITAHHAISAHTCFQSLEPAYTHAYCRLHKYMNTCIWSHTAMHIHVHTYMHQCMTTHTTLYLHKCIHTYT
jgi:hypothetical protein